MVTQWDAGFHLGHERNPAPKCMQAEIKICDRMEVNMKYSSADEERDTSSTAANPFRRHQTHRGRHGDDNNILH